MQPQTAFAARMKLHRLRKNWSQAQLAEATGIYQQTLSRWESGNRHPTIWDAQLIARALDLSLDEMTKALSQEELDELEALVAAAAKWGKFRHTRPELILV